MGGVERSDRELAALRYVRDHNVATTTSIARDLFGAPRTTFGRILRHKNAEEILTALTRAGLLARTGDGLDAEFTLTDEARRTLRNAALGPPFSGSP